MPTNPTDIFNSEAFLVTLKAAVLLILIFYAIFSLIIIRQVNLMSKTLITAISPTLKILTLIHAFFTIVLIVVAWGIL